MSIDEAVAATGHPLDSVECARALDAADELRNMRDEFHMPLHADGTEQVYLTGNSLGLQPKSTAAAVTAELQKWAAIGVGGHFTGDLPWAQCEEKLPELLGEVVGAEEREREARRAARVAKEVAHSCGYTCACTCACTRMCMLEWVPTI